ncbi:MAG: mechanosensitive ion channel family protein [Acidobacteriota bacterium]|nr:mechanosensitive ion channel family protein [Acidobacteriota bacterium]
MLGVLEAWLVQQGLGDSWATLTAVGTGIGAVLTLAVFSDLVAKRLLVRAVAGLASRTESRWDDAIVSRRVFHRLAHLVPAIVIYISVPVLLETLDTGPAGLAATAVRVVSSLYMIAVVVSVLDGALNAAVDIMRPSDFGRGLPLTSFAQVAKLVLYGAALLLGWSVVIGESPLLLFSGLGAMTAVLMFIFKDAILGFIAGVQLSANQMVRRGDWIEMPKYGADGDVLEVALTTVKVQNFDKTITTIPTYALISESFKNWRGMAESPGRRIKRSIHLDMRSVSFCDDAMLARLEQMDYMTAYLATKREELSVWRTGKAAAGCGAYPRQLTNLGTFRAYVEAYLRHHPDVHQRMTLLVRQLEPTEFGLPLEVYCFSRNKTWVRYEALQSDIFDHLLAVVSNFELRVYQVP